MEKNKKNWFVRWYELETKIYEKSPIGRSIEKIMFFIFLIALFGGSVWMMIHILKPIPFEVEGSCNTGFVGIDYEMDFENQPYKREMWRGLSDARNITDYDIINIPKHLNIKNIEGLNCNFKINGAIPLNKLQEADWQWR